MHFVIGMVGLGLNLTGAVIVAVGYASLLSTGSQSVRGQPTEPWHSAPTQTADAGGGELNGSIASPAPVADSMENMPEEWRSGGDYTLHVRKATIALPGGTEDGDSFVLARGCQYQRPCAGGCGLGVVRGSY